MPQADQPTTLLHWLTREFPRGKRETFKQMLTHGRIRVNGAAPAKLTQPLGPDDRVRILSREQSVPKGPRPNLQPLKLINEDDDNLIVDKPAGFLTSTVENERRATALATVRRYVAARDAKAPVGLIHRLDRDASGLLVFSKSHRAYKSLKTQFFHHTVERVYEAVVEGIPSPKQGRIESMLLERADGSVRSTPLPGGKAQRAITDYEVLQSRGGKSLVRVSLLTGRKHQIRVHFAGRGNPIIGDRVYGDSAGKNTNKSGGKDTAGDLQLRAVILSIDHPATGKRVSFSVPQNLTFSAS